MVHHCWMLQFNCFRWTESFKALCPLGKKSTGLIWVWVKWPQKYKRIIEPLQHWTVLWSKFRRDLFGVVTHRTVEINEEVEISDINASFARALCTYWSTKFIKYKNKCTKYKTEMCKTSALLSDLAKWPEQQTRRLITEGSSLLSLNMSCWTAVTGAPEVDKERMSLMFNT